MTAFRGQRGFTLIELMVVIVIISVLAGFAMLRMNRLQPDSAGACAEQARNWFSGLAAKAIAGDTTIYVTSNGGHWQAFVLGRKKDKLVSLPVDKLVLNPACELISNRGGHGGGDLPATLKGSWLAVTADGRWLARNGKADIELTDASGQHQSIALDQLNIGDTEEKP